MNTYPIKRLVRISSKYLDPSTPFPDPLILPPYNRLHNRRVRESGTAEFECTAFGQPDDPDYSWWRDGKMVVSNARVTVSDGKRNQVREENNFL